jgi:hypothetical protein
MFSVLPERGSDDEDYPFPAQFRLIGTVVMGEDADANLVGMRRGNGLSDGYNPFDLYGAAERARGKPLPPHLVFAELDKESPDDACAFLNAYGPLESTNLYWPLKEEERREWKKRASKSPSPEEHFRSTLGDVPVLPKPPAPQGGEDFYGYSLALFWLQQSEFELALRLHTALGSRNKQLEEIQLRLALAGVQWEIRGRNIEREYINRARDFVMTTINKHLRAMSPRVSRVPGSSSVTAVWGCYTLLEAMYLMLFLDIAGWNGQIVQCEKCHSVFYSALQRGKYCSTKCENRARALRSYYKKAAATSSNDNPTSKNDQD